MQARRRVGPFGGYRFLSETQSSARDSDAREIQAKISTPQDTLDARHDMTRRRNLMFSRHTGGRQQQYVDFRDVTRRKNTPSKHSATPTRGTNVASGRYGQRLEPCFPTLWTETKTIGHSFEFSADTQVDDPMILRRNTE